MTQEQYERACLLQKRINHAQIAIERLKYKKQDGTPDKNISLYMGGQALSDNNEIYGDKVFLQALIDFYISQRDKAQQEFEYL